MVFGCGATNHVHSVVTAACNPGRILNAMKSNANRELREARQWSSSNSPWADRGSKRYLWTGAHLIKAINDVEFDQGDVFPSLDDIG
jgi:REP element-mobilizing transposase RayT